MPLHKGTRTSQFPRWHGQQPCGVAASRVVRPPPAAGVVAQPLYCTKIASKLARTFTDRHGLRDLCHDLLGIDLDKEQQTSDWGSDELTARQLSYAASDVLHLHDIRVGLDEMLLREGRAEFAEACFRFVPVRARLDLGGWDDIDIFAH